MPRKDKSSLGNLETSKFWKQTATFAENARHFAEALPHAEHYTLANPIIQNATLLTSDIAFAIGKGDEKAADYRYARGHLFTVKGLILMAQHYEVVHEIRHILNEANGILNTIDAKIKELETQAKE
jgi:hypothetical protein